MHDWMFQYSYSADEPKFLRARPNEFGHIMRGVWWGYVSKKNPCLSPLYNTLA